MGCEPLVERPDRFSISSRRCVEFLRKIGRASVLHSSSWNTNRVETCDSAVNPKTEVELYIVWL